MRRAIEKLREEFLKMLPPTIYFFIALHIVSFIRVLMLKQTVIAPTTSVSVAVLALILGKAVLIADMLPAINRFPEKPLIYNIGWKTAIYLLVSIVVHYVERLVEFGRQAGGFVAGNEKLLAEIVWPHFWALQIVLFMLILIYCTTTEMARVLGKDRLRRIFLGPLPAPPSPEMAHGGLTIERRWPRSGNRPRVLRAGRGPCRAPRRHRRSRDRDTGG